MSTLAVKIEKILSIEKHPNADRLDIIKVLDWYCAVQRSTYKINDLVLYIPIDSVLPENIENALFGIDSKIKLSNHRVKTIKLRGMISQGIVCKPELFGITEYKEGEDFTVKLGITKFEPPAKLPSGYGNMRQPKKMYINSNFKKYTDIENIKNYKKVFTDGEIVYISEKLHGTSWRGGWLPNEANTIWKRIKKLFGLLNEYEFVFGSRNVQLSSPKYKDKFYYDENVYGRIVEQYNLKNKLKKGEVLYGEIVGKGIQGGYDYGFKDNIAFFAYDIIKDSKYVNYVEFKSICYEMNLPTVPDLYVGPYSLDKVKELTKGSSILSPEAQPIREGCVVKPVIEDVSSYVGRKILKSINDDYLLNDNTDFH